MMKKINKMVEIAKNLGWSVRVEGNGFSLQQFSPAGQDFNIEIEAEDIFDFIAELKYKYEGFDVSTETYLWLDNEGHGTNGAPYDMKDLYEDMEECKKMMSDLLEELEQIDFDEMED